MPILKRNSSLWKKGLGSARTYGRKRTSISIYEKVGTSTNLQDRCESDASFAMEGGLPLGARTAKSQKSWIANAGDSMPHR